MARLSLTSAIVAILGIGAVVCAALGFAGFEEEVANGLLFAAWGLALVALFILALRLPLRGGRSAISAWTVTALVTVGAVAVVVAANVALFRHDVHFDVTREARHTPPQQFTTLVSHLRTPLSLTYFYNGGDVQAIAARDMMAVVARGHPLFNFRAIDLDREPGLARDVGVRAYNTALIQAGERKVLIENNTDVTRIAYAAMRALKEKAETVCFAIGHGETFRPLPSHFHFSHRETYRGHDDPGSGDVLEGNPADLDRLQLALTEIGYATKPIELAAASAIPADCTVVADVGPRVPYTAGEADLMVKYLSGGGRLLLLLDPVFPIEPSFEKNVLGAIGLSTDQAVVIDPLNHFRSDPDKVVVPYYMQHPIAEGLGMTVFPQVRPITVKKPPDGVNTTVLAGSSEDSYAHALSSATAEIGSAEQAAPPSDQRKPHALVVAVEGVWPGAPSGKRFRLVVGGSSKIASNEYFGFVSDGQLSVAMLRWLAADDAMPTLQPQSYKLPEIVLTARQMREVFFVLEVILPLSTLLCGALVWWRRR